MENEDSHATALSSLQPALLNLHKQLLNEALPHHDSVACYDHSNDMWGNWHFIKELGFAF